MATNWTDELKKEVVKEYESRNPTPENTTEVLKAMQEEVFTDKTVNGLRMVLIQEDAYIKKDPGSSKSSSSKSNSDKPKRVSKADAVAGLVEILEAQAVEVDEELINRLTGKAAIYFTNAFKQVLGEDEVEDE